MNQDLKDLKKIRDHIVGLEMKLDLIKGDLRAVEGDLIFLESMEINLTENMRILKQDGIVTKASEYKKIQIELDTVNKNLVFYRDVKEQLLRDLVRYEKITLDAWADYELKKQKYESRQVVLQFDPSKRKK